MKLKLLLIILVSFVSVCFVNAQTPVASFQANDTAICTSNCITFTNNSTNGTSYLWNFPGGTPATSPFQDPGSVCYSAAGSYDVTLIATNTNGADTVTLHHYITVGLLPTLQVTGGPLCDPTKLDWAQWTSVTSDTVKGFISSNLSMTVAQSAGGLSTTGSMYDGYKFPDQYNIPISSPCIKNVNAGIFTFCFSHPVIDPQIALSSIGNGGLNVQVTTSAPYQIIWAGPGMTYANDTTMAGQEGYTIVQFPGVQTCISFDYHQSENYCNIAFGVLDTNCQATTIPPLCSGGAGVTLTATGNVALQNAYTWAPDSGLTADTGAIVTASPLHTTTYSVTCTSGNCSVTDTVTVTVVASPQVVIGGVDTICQGVVDTIVPMATNGVSYLWNTGDTTSYTVADPNNSNTYILTVTAPNACTASAEISVTVNDTPNISIAGLTAFCAGDSSTLDAGSGFSNYLWSTSSSSETINVDTGGNYSVTVTDVNGCVGSGAAVITENALPPAPTPYQGSGDTIYSTTDSSYASYQWYDDTTLISSATGSFLVITHQGVYYVQVMNSNNCAATGSIAAIYTGVKNYSSGNFFSLYPNPARDQFTIEISSALRSGVIEIYNPLGEKMYAEEFTGEKKDIVFNAAAGIYFVQIKSDAGTSVKKLLIR